MRSHLMRQLILCSKHFVWPTPCDLTVYAVPAALARAVLLGKS